jgi:hypothetical protein
MYRTHSQWAWDLTTEEAGGGVRSPANVVVALRKIH